MVQILYKVYTFTNFFDKMALSPDEALKKLMRGARQRVAQKTALSEVMVDKVRKGEKFNPEISLAWQEEEKKAKVIIEDWIKKGIVERQTA